MERLKNILTKLKENLSREKLIAISCIIVAATAIIISTVLFVFAKSESGDQGDDTIIKPVESTERSTYPPTSPKSLEFQSIGSGQCVVLSIGGFSGEELEIPSKSPDGEEVVGIASGAFEGCDSLISISIPNTVVTIGDGVFKGCSSLVLISVDSANSKFASSGGILFSKNKSILICYPPDRVGSSYLLNPNVKVIADHAFYGVKNLNKINYEGSVAEFSEISVGSGNKAFTEIPITCNYYPSK